MLRLPRSGYMTALKTYIVITTMLNAMTEKSLTAAKEVSRKLRREGAYREAVNWKIGQLNVRIPRSLMISPILQESAWIRDSLAQAGHKMIDWCAAMRPKDIFGNWLAKGEYGHSYDLRDREQTTYEPRLTMSGYAAVRGRGIALDFWGDKIPGKSHLVQATLRLRKGMLLNGTNEQVWCYSVSRKHNRLMAAYRAMKDTGSVRAAIEAALSQGEQKWMPACFFNILDLDGEVVFSQFADRAYEDGLQADGHKTRTTPFIAATGGEN